MNPYISYREQNSEGQYEYFILQKAFPHIVGEIKLVPEKHFVEAATLSGYNMWVVFKNTLRGNSIPSYPDIFDEISLELEQMATWYLDNRIKINEKKYSKYKL